MTSGFRRKQQSNMMVTPAVGLAHSPGKKLTSAVIHSLALAISSLISYWLVTPVPPLGIGRADRSRDSRDDAGWTAR